MVFAKAIIACALLGLTGHAHADSYPTKPIRFITGYPAGSASDNVARTLGQQLSDIYRQQVVVDNRPGAAGNIAAEITAKSPPDGYTILLVATNHAIVSSLYAKLSFDPVADFAPVALVSTAPTILVVHPSLPVKSVPEFIDFVKARPGQLSYGSSGNGASPHLNMELLKTMSGISITHIPYKGIPQALTELLGGQIQAMFSTMAPAVPHVKAGRLRAIAVSGPKRAPATPEVPTVSESIPGFESLSWQGVLAPAGTPSSIISDLNAKILKVIHMPEVTRRLVASGFDPVGSTPDEFGAFIKTESVKWSKVVKAAGAKLD
jgi:tripartite-type tricarboxylate transporter receptor subunit TctC